MLDIIDDNGEKFAVREKTPRFSLVEILKGGGGKLADVTKATTSTLAPRVKKSVELAAYMKKANEAW